MRGWRQICGRSHVSRLVLVLSLAGLAAGCSSGNVRLAGTPLFASNTAEPSAMAPIESSDLPPATSMPGGPLTTSASLKAKGYTLENAPIVEVGAADTANTLSVGYGVPVDVILEANGFTTIADVRPGQRLIIPVKTQPVAPAPATQTAALGPSTLGAQATTLNQQAAEGRHVVQPGDTMATIAAAHRVSPQALAQLNGMPDGAAVSPGQTLRIPTQSLSAPTQTATAPTTALDAAPAPSQATALAPQPDEPQIPQAPVLEASVPAASTATAAPQQDQTASAGSGFRWPVQGRIIAGFGKQADGARNDGINLAVPAGTPVHAAESGTVIYAGNELEGYGNLVLIQHEDEWVSAYAHNEALKVSRGDKVSRGQQIGSAGKTGSVSQPQVHFELRKKSKPVDPLPLLSGGA